MENSLATAHQRQVLSVSQLNLRVRQLLETHLPLLWVEGELTNLARPSSGHWYFTLKDDQAQVRCAMFRRRAQPALFTPANGQQVLVRCRVGLYENRGDYQLIVEHIEPAGFGALQRQFEQLKAKLAAEGLFAPERKRPLPSFPSQIGVITSPTGAAIRDILHVLARRFAAIPVLIYPTAVQGADAAAQIVAALTTANRRRDCDLLILSRGGGSLEDLAPFNDERVARAIAASAIPVISGVGHETDTTIADFVADMRAPTPSAAAELATPDSAELYASFVGYDRWLGQHMRHQLQGFRQQLDGFRKRLRHPREALARQTQHLDHLEIRLVKAIAGCLRELHQRMERVATRQRQVHPQRRLDDYTQTLGLLDGRATRGVRQLMATRRNDLAKATALLHAVSPLNTLARGYAIVRNQHRQIVASTALIRSGDTVSVTVTDGNFDCTVDRIQGGEPL
ncbi:MAG: exodeoxyribonuclease VII large subunit [Porticoccaceae bacterium]